MKKLLLTISLVVMPFTLLSQKNGIEWKTYRSNDCLDNLMEYEIIISEKNWVNFLFKNKTDKWIGLTLYDDKGYHHNIGVGPNTTGGKSFQTKNQKLEIHRPSFDGKRCED